MAFTELNFVPGEVVTAAKMNLLAANDVWLRGIVESSTPKLENLYLSHSKEFSVNSSPTYIHIFEKTIEPEYDGKLAIFNYEISPFELPDTFGHMYEISGGVVVEYNSKKDHHVVDVMTRLESGGRLSTNRIVGSALIRLKAGQKISLYFYKNTASGKISFSTNRLNMMVF